MLASLWPALFSMCHSFIHSLSCSCFCCPLCRSGPMTFKACSSSSNSTSWKSHSGAEKPGVSLLLCWFSSLIRPLCLQSGCYRSSSYILSALDPVESKVPAPDDFTHVLGLLRVTIATAPSPCWGPHTHQQPHVPPHLILTATLKDFVCISFTDSESETQSFEGAGQGPQWVVKAQMESI